MVFWWKRGKNNTKGILSEKEKRAVEDIVEKVKDKGVGEVVKMERAGEYNEETHAWKEEDGKIFFKQYGEDHIHSGFIDTKTGEVFRSSELKPDEDS